jgi:hypothetical protein
MQKLMKLFDELESALGKMKTQELVDTGAKLSGMKTRIEALMDKHVKPAILLKAGKPDKEGRFAPIAGQHFQAVVQIIVTDRIDVTKLRTEQPKIWTKYSVESPSNRVTFKVLA